MARGADRLVRSRVVGRAGGAGTPIIYRMRQQDGRWQVLDVVSKGVSQVAVQRSDFAGAVSQGGLPGLTARLAELNAKERARG